MALRKKLKGLTGFEKALSDCLLGVCFAVEQDHLYFTLLGYGWLRHRGTAVIFREVDPALAALQEIQGKWVPLSHTLTCREDHADYYDLPEQEVLTFESSIDELFRGDPEPLMCFCQMTDVDKHLLLPIKHPWEQFRPHWNELNLDKWSHNLVEMGLYLTRQVRPLLQTRQEQTEERKARKFLRRRQRQS